MRLVKTRARHVVRSLSDGYVGSYGRGKCSNFPFDFEHEGVEMGARRLQVNCRRGRDESKSGSISEIGRWVWLLWHVKVFSQKIHGRDISMLGPRYALAALHTRSLCQ